MGEKQETPRGPHRGWTHPCDKPRLTKHSETRGPSERTGAERWGEPPSPHTGSARRARLRRALRVIFTVASFAAGDLT